MNSVKGRKATGSRNIRSAKYSSKREQASLLEKSDQTAFYARLKRFMSSSAHKIANWMIIYTLISLLLIKSNYKC